jgi:SAM-dependent methyltransferase
MLARYMPPGTVLDVGAAAGFILHGLIDSGWRGEGIEPNAQMAAYARTQLQVRVHVGSFEQFQPGTTYDLITMIQVMAHFLAPRQVLQKARTLLRPGGYVLIETWNRASWTARCWGWHWHEYSPPSVVQWFTPEGLGQLAAQSGFQEVARGRPGKWLSGAHAKSLVGHVLPDSGLGRWAYRLLQVIPDRLAIPYPAEDLFWMLLQRSSHEKREWSAEEAQT